MPIGSSVWTPSTNMTSITIPKSFLIEAIPQFVKILAEFSFYMGHFDTMQACQVLDTSSSLLCDPSSQSRPSLRANNADTSSWDRLMAPFLLLAAAEELTLGLAFIAQDETSPLLTGLYLRIQMELRKLKDLVGITTSDAALPTEPLPVEASSDDAFRGSLSTVSQYIDCVLEICKVRCKLIDLQNLLFLQRSTAAQIGMQQAAIVIAQLQQSFHNAIQRIGAPSSLPVNGMISFMTRELDLWQHLFETCSALEQCA